MNRNPVSCEDLTTNQHTDPQSAPTKDSRAWHRPTITVIDVKRTMFSIGGYFDGLDSSIS
jgi:hypothetical protein